MTAITVTSENYDDEVVNSHVPVLIDFWAPWCGPCRMVSPIVDELSQELGEKVKVVKINTDDEPELAASFQIMSIPTLAVVKEGKITARSVGAKPKEEIRKLLDL